MIIDRKITAFTPINCKVGSIFFSLQGRKWGGCDVVCKKNGSELFFLRFLSLYLYKFEK